MFVIRGRLYAHPVDHMMFVACTAVSFIMFFYILLFPFFIIVYMVVYFVCLC